MVFDIRQLTDYDYDSILIEWWKRWKWDAPPRESLPSAGEGGFSGFMVSKSGIDICAGFVYFTNSNMAWCEFVVSNPDYKQDDRAEAIEYLLNEISKYAKRLGFKVLWTCVVHENLKNKYINCGFVETQKGASELLKIL